MQRPDVSSVGLRREQCASIVGEPVHAVRRALLCRRFGAACLRASTASAAFSSSTVRRPCSDSHAATAASPSSIASASEAARFSHAERLKPCRSALPPARSAIRASRATESFFTLMSRWYYHVPTASTPTMAGRPGRLSSRVTARRTRVACRRRSSLSCSSRIVSPPGQRRAADPAWRGRIGDASAGAADGHLRRRAADSASLTYQGVRSGRLALRA